MAKIKNRILIILALVMLCAVGIFALSACGGSETYTVTFMVRENGTTGDWQQYTTVDTNDDGSVTLPAEPTVDGYTFRDWYTDEACSADNVFDESKVTGDITVYALMAEANITLNVRDGAGQVETTDNFALTGLEAKTAEYEADALADDLTFVGWFTDAAYTQEYTSGMDVTTLYGRYMAEVTFDNGVDGDEYIEYIVPGDELAQPSSGAIVKNYMDDEDIRYIYAENKEEVSFPVAVSSNILITVQWATDGLDYVENQNGTYTAVVNVGSGSNPFNNLSVISIPAEHSGWSVEAVSFNSLSSLYFPALQMIIVQDGVKAVSGLNGGNNSAVSSVVLPESLLVLTNSFNGFPNMTVDSFTLPENLEVCIGCFFATESTSSNTNNSGEYDFEVNIPASVENLAYVPTNLVFAENSIFTHDDAGNIYTDNDTRGKLFIAANDNGSGSVPVADGYKGIQVGAFFGIENLEYLTLPSDWEYVAYNAQANEYMYCVVNGYGNSLFLWMEEGATDPTKYNLFHSGAYAIVNNLENIERIRVLQSSLPKNVTEFAFVGRSNGSYSSFIDAFASDNKVVFVGTISDGELVSIIVQSMHQVTGETDFSKTFTVESGTELTLDIVLDEIGFDSSSYEVVSVTQFGEIYTWGEVSSNQYLDFVYTNIGGVLIEEVNGVMTVTGIDENIINENGAVIIPGEYKGKTVTAIKTGAFKDNTSITSVFIPASITDIGAEAFMNTINLTTVTFESGSLISVIGRSAFENSGFTEIALPLTHLTDVQPFAFKSDKLTKFIAVEKESLGMYDLSLAVMTDYIYQMFGKDFFTENNIEPGDYFFISGADDFAGINIALVKYVGSSKTTTGTNENPDEKTVEVTVHDVELIAIAGGSDISWLSLGYSSRGAQSGTDAKYVCRFKINEGSIYYLDNVTTIDFGFVSEVEKNAFTDMNEDNIKIVVHAGARENTAYDEYMDLSDIQSIDSSIFAEGWWGGDSSSQISAIMAAATKTSNTGVMMICH